MVYFGRFTCVFPNSICTVSIALCVGAVLQQEDVQNAHSYTHTDTQKGFPQMLCSVAEGNLEMGARSGTSAQKARSVGEKQISQGLSTTSPTSTEQFSCRQGRVDHTVTCINLTTQTEPEDRLQSRSIRPVLAVTLASPIVQKRC